LTGCSPAFLYAFTQSLADAAMAQGVAKDIAVQLARASVAGAAALAASRPQMAPADMIAQVASKGGMTQAGLDILQRDKALTQMMMDTLKAAADRGQELA
jgi:pyrroline-5-carboxylate reductase